MSLYDELGLSSDATQDEIKEAYRRRASETHPDKEGGDHAAFIRVKAAYDVLSDPVKRAEYDAMGDMEGPEFQLRNTIAQAFSHFAQLDDLPETDLVLVIKNEFAKSRKNGRVELKRLRRVVKNYKKLSNRIKTKDKVVLGILRKKREEILKQAMHLRLQIQIGGLLLEMMDEYSYVYAKPTQRPAWQNASPFATMFLTQGMPGNGATA